jgi:hypothetical protein
MFCCIRLLADYRASHISPHQHYECNSELGVVSGARDAIWGRVVVIGNLHDITICAETKVILGGPRRQNIVSCV